MNPAEPAPVEAGKLGSAPVRRLSAFIQTGLMVFAAAMICWQLFVPPILGVADNGDYGKLSRHACIGPASADFPYFEYTETRFSVRESYCGSIIPSSAVLPLFASAALGRWMLPAGQFDLRVLAALYAVLFAIALWVLLRKATRSVPLAGWVTGSCAILVFCSATYIPLFNSFYMDAASLVYLAWAVVLGIGVLTDDHVGALLYVAFAAAVLLLATSKMQYLLASLAFLPILWSRSGPRFPGVWVRAGASAAVLAGALIYASAGSPWYKAITLYDGLFYKFLPAVPEPAAELRRMGLGPQFEQYVGQHAYSAGTRMQREDFAVAFGEIVTIPKMVRFLIEHPAAVWQGLRKDLNEASLERVRMVVGDKEYRLGNYHRNEGKGPEAQSHFMTFWSDLKFAVFARRPLIYLGYVVTLVIALWVAALFQPTGRRAALFGVFSVTSLLPAFFGPAFLDAVDTGRHLFLFNCALDLCFLAFLWLTVRALKPQVAPRL